MTFDFEVDIERVSNVKFVLLGSIGIQLLPSHGWRVSSRVSLELLASGSAIPPPGMPARRDDVQDAAGKIPEASH
ncbi:MAG: hypothetical protein K8H74_08965 [Notoacmeibacter sp.]|nr:hypothetical protein [Notoacmeibacter sp.]